MNTASKTVDIVNTAVADLACVTVDDLKAMDYDTLKAMKDNMAYFMSALTTVTAAKRAEKDQMEETNKHIADREAKLAAKQNINATVETFDNLDNKDKNPIISLGKLYHHARRGNNFAAMEMMKNKILEQLCDLNIGNQYVVGHVIHLAK